MKSIRFGDVVIDTKEKVDRSNNPYQYYIAGDHMDSEDLELHRRGSFETDDVGPAFIRLFKKGQVLYGSRRTYLKKVAVAHFDGVTANTTFVFDPKNENLLIRELIPFLMLSDGFTEWSISKSKGSTNPYVLFSDLADYKCLVPEIPEQKRLAETLWFLEQSKREYALSIEKIDQYIESLFNDNFGEKQAAQNNWQELPIIDLIEKPLSGEWGSDDLNNSGIKVLRTTNFTDEGLIDYSNVVTRSIPLKKIAEKRLVDGDILIEKSGGADDKPVGRVVYFNKGDDEYLFNNFTSVLRIKDERISSKYLFTFLFIQYNIGLTKRYENKTTGIHNLKLTEYLSETKIPVPDIQIQNRFVEKLEKLLEMKASFKETIEDIKAFTFKLVNKSFKPIKEE